MNIIRVYFYKLISIALLLLGGCAKEIVTYNNVADIYFTVVDDRNTPINGATVNLYDNLTAYETAVASKYNPPAGIRSYTTKATAIIKNGASFIQNGYVHLDNLQPDMNYYLLITYYDDARQINMSNIGISGILNPLPKKSAIYAQTSVGPDNGNFLFFTVANNKIPISIQVSGLSGQQKNFTLTGISSLSNPDVKSPNIVRVSREPGSYNYYAKSLDGCAWTGYVTLSKGQSLPIDLSKCNNGTVQFTTIADNDSLYPLSIQLNNNLNVGSISSTDTRSFSLPANAGFYTYIVKSSSNRCVWTGSFTVQTDEIIQIPLKVCE
jgi:hypothetical protein